MTQLSRRFVTYCAPRHQPLQSGCPRIGIAVAAALPAIALWMRYTSGIADKAAATRRRGEISAARDHRRCWPAAATARLPRPRQPPACHDAFVAALRRPALSRCRRQRPVGGATVGSSTARGSTAGDATDAATGHGRSRLDRAAGRRCLVGLGRTPRAVHAQARRREHPRHLSAIHRRQRGSRTHRRRDARDARRRATGLRRAARAHGVRAQRRCVRARPAQRRA